MFTAKQKTLHEFLETMKLLEDINVLQIVNSRNLQPGAIHKAKF